jgi:hypothetical protein
MLINKLLKKVSRNIYIRNSNDYPTIVTGKNPETGFPVFQACIKTKNIEAKPIYGLNKREIDHVCVKMIDIAATVQKYDEFHLFDSKGLNSVGYDMTKWDCVPKTLLVSSAIKIPELMRKTIIIHVKSHTCSTILNNSIIADFELNIIEFHSKEPISYMLPEPHILGQYSTFVNNGISILVKPQCIKIVWRNNE